MTVVIDGRRWEPPAPERVLAGFAQIAAAIRPRLAGRTAPTTLAVLRAVAGIAAEHQTFRPVAAVRDVAHRAGVGHDTAMRHLKVLCSSEVRALERAGRSDDREDDDGLTRAPRSRAYQANYRLMMLSIGCDALGYDQTVTTEDAQTSLVVRECITAPSVLRHRTGRGPLHGLVVGALSDRPAAVAEVAAAAGCGRNAAGKHLRDAETDGTAQRVPSGRHHRWVRGERTLSDVRIDEAEAAAQRQAERYRLDRAAHADRLELERTYRAHWRAA